MRASAALIIGLLLSASIGAQDRLVPPKGASVPAACNIGDLFTKTAATAGLYVCTAANTWTLVTSGAATGAPSDATYITQTASSGLSAEQALSTLSSGIMRVATTTGVITALTSSAGIAANLSDESGTGLVVFNDTATLATPVLSGTVTGTYTLGGTPTLASAAGVPYVGGVSASYKLARGETALDGSNPTPVASGLTAIVACTLTIKTTAAPGVSTSVVTYDTATSTLNLYGWKVTATSDATLIASTGTDTIGWVCIGT